LQTASPAIIQTTLSSKKIRWSITLICAALFAAHHLWPEFRLDLPSTILVLVAILPWLAPVIKSVEIPGGFKIELQDVKAATDKALATLVTGAADAKELKSQPLDRPFVKFMPASGSATTRETGAQPVEEIDARVRLIIFRTELQRRIIALARESGIATEAQSALSLLQELAEKDVLPVELSAALTELIALANQAAHGAPVSAGAARWLKDTSPAILLRLDQMIKERWRQSPT